MTDSPARSGYLFPGEEESSPAADDLIAEFKALEDQVIEKHGEGVIELPI